MKRGVEAEEGLCGIDMGHAIRSSPHQIASEEPPTPRTRTNFRQLMC